MMREPIRIGFSPPAVSLRLSVDRETPHRLQSAGRSNRGSFRWLGALSLTGRPKPHMCAYAIFFVEMFLDVTRILGLIDSVIAMDHSLKLLRKHFAKSPELRVFSTQGGFAKLVGRSEGYIRNVENGVVPLSLKLAEAVEEKTGVSAKWLLKPGKPDSVSPPSKPDGKDWEPAVAIRLIKAEIDTGKQALTQLIAEATRTGTSVPDLIGGLVKTALEADLARGSLDLLVEIANLLRDNGHMHFSQAPENKP